MNKIWLIIKREYLTRVRNRTFILSTILLPLFFIGFIFASAYFSISSQEKQKIAVQDSNGIFKNSFQSNDQIIYEYPTGVNAENFKEKGYSAFLKIPENYNSGSDSISLISTKQLGMDAEGKIKDQIDEAIKNQAFLKNNIDKKILDSINKINEENSYQFRTVVKQGNKTSESNSGLSYGIGYGSGILIYMTLFIYGAAVMRGVMEEKMNRIAEVIISSVRPFQLMIGKILGIAAVGLTQLLIWIILIILLSSVTTSIFTADALHHAQAMNTSIGAAGSSSAAINFLNAKSTFLSADWALIIPCFLFYFLAGYLFYASLFAAVGSVVNEDPQEAQSLMLPITMPIILSFVIMTTAVGKPDAPVSVWASIIPFSSPIVMMARIPSGNVPAWQIILSMLSLIAGFILTTMLAAKIYRTGILLYGKKVTFKEMGKWLFRKA
ncbi:MAG TPA: ABC transporter permease [Hanamia sp.]|jgi:ABC-2 type transport system permease protein|nr:ABC transporter permease [Hanamia sp.]